MGIRTDSQEAVPTEAVKDMVVVYRAMIDAMRSANKPGFDRVRYNRLELKCDLLWQKLSRPEQILAIDELIATGHINPDLAIAIKAVNGTLATDEMAKRAEIKR